MGKARWAGEELAREVVAREEEEDGGKRGELGEMAGAK